LRYKFQQCTHSQVAKQQCCSIQMLKTPVQVHASQPGAHN